ncbi:hypothetical protein SRB17_23070 [Streptomyces sp. RB17]|nr:hypothetical protein [Streptomyces sp. RB17]
MNAVGVRASGDSGCSGARAVPRTPHGAPPPVDRNGNTLVTLRVDGTGPQSYESAQRKVFTAGSWNAPTSEPAERLEQAPGLQAIPGTLFLTGPRR